MKRLTVFLLFVIFTLAQNPATLVDKCSYDVESFILSRDIFPRIAIGSIKNHSLRGKNFIENLYELFLSRFSDYMIASEGVIGFDSTGGFFSPPPGYDFLLRITYQEIGGEAHISIRIYSKDGKLKDFISCSSPLNEFAYREFEIKEGSGKKPLLLWEAEVEGHPLAVQREGENILLLYPDRLVTYRKRGGFLVRRVTKKLSWPKPYYPSLDIRGIISSITLGNSRYIALGISTSANYLYLDASDLSIAGELPWIPIGEQGEKVFLGKFSAGKNYFRPELGVKENPESLEDLTSVQVLYFLPFYDFCVLENMLNVIDIKGKRRVFKDGEEVPTPDERMGDEIECWNSFLFYSGFGKKEKLSFRDFQDFDNSGEVGISGKIINMTSENDGSVIILVEENGRFWVKEFKIE